MSQSSARRVEIAAPAKLNLGLEVIRRREDGFHEIATIFLAIDLFDDLVLTPHREVKLSCETAGFAGADNLALRALHALRDETGYDGGAHIELHKRIPAAAGLGGASSDATAALLAARDLWGLAVTDDTLHRLAARLGSDVPFFLHGGCAIGRGRGEVLAPLPVPQAVWFVVVVPEIAIPQKTARQYALLDPEDFSDGSRIVAQAAQLAAGFPFDPKLLGNAFARPLYELAPRLADLPDTMRRAGAASISVSGAGPTHFASVPDLGRAELIAARLRDRLADTSQVFLASPTSGRPQPVRPL